MRIHNGVKFSLVVTFLFGLLAVKMSCSGDSDSTTPEEVRYGWSGPESLVHTAVWASKQPDFQITDPVTGQPIAEDNLNARVVLWDLVKAANDGEYPEEFPQQIGDCTSFGGAHAIQGTEGAQIANGQEAKFHKIFPPFLYGAGRVLILKGRLGRQDGCSGAAIAQAAMTIGVLNADEDGLPKYDGALARLWGARGPPQEWIEKAAATKVKTVSRLESADDVRDAICNFYGVTIASNFGTSTIQPRDGKMVAVWNAKWPHQMCVDGYDGTGKTHYYHVQNSWGAKAHPAPIDDSPPGGFWITERDMDRIAKQGDTWAFSSFDGFPAVNEELNLHVFGAPPGAVGAANPGGPAAPADRAGPSRPPRKTKAASGAKKTTVAP